MNSPAPEPKTPPVPMVSAGETTPAAPRVPPARKGTKVPGWLAMPLAPKVLLGLAIPLAPKVLLGLAIPLAPMVSAVGRPARVPLVATVREGAKRRTVGRAVARRAGSTALGNTSRPLEALDHVATPRACRAERCGARRV
ncbi:hypothetical protein [Nocardia blacklockiae]|uniref:hypothetical protein n=1 Tax=Nocardia blacklockiae TaxID=480036 RepID=UPI001894CF4B|nr:hypothetical protein [Nocardia blacklockiae]MBF6174114.1 hypothetical protein [Nocardia blacklockiae]